jgi:hypothetical protein
VEDVFETHGFDLEGALDAIARQGATSVPLLAEGFRMALLEEAEAHLPARQVVGSGERRAPAVSTCETFHPGSLYLDLQALQQLLRVAWPKSSPTRSKLPCASTH